MATKGGECSTVQSEFHSISSQDEEKEEKEEEPAFIEQPPDRYICLICHCVMKEPHIVTCCCNKMCRDCIQRVHFSSQPCPTCREPNFNSFLEKRLNSEILDLKVRCTHHNNGCEWVGELRDLKKHTNPVDGSCGFVTVKCPFGCPVAYLRKDTIDHESVCTNLPPERQIKRTMRITDQVKEELQATLSQFQELYKSESTRVKELTTQLELGLEESRKKEQQHEKMKSQFEAEKKQLLEESKQQIALLTQELKMKNEEHQQQMKQLQQESKKKQKEIFEASNKQLAELKEKMEKQHQRKLTDIKDKMSIELKELLQESKQQVTLLTQELKMKNEEHEQQMMQLQQEFKKKEKERSEAVNKQLAELKEKEKQMEKQHQKQITDIKDKLSTELKELYQDEHKQRMEESKEQSKNIHQKLKQHYDEEYQQQLKEAEKTLELEKRKQLEEVRVVLAIEKEKLITEYAEECKKATAVTQTNLLTKDSLALPSSHHAQHNPQAMHTHDAVNPILEQVPHEGGSNEEVAATGSGSAGDGKTFTGLSKDVLLLMPKVREECSKSMKFFPEEGKVIVLASSEEEREQCITQFTNAYQEIIKNRQLKSGSLEIPPGFQMENMFDLLEEFDGKYSQCHFSCDEKARVVKIVSMSSRQFDQAKKLIAVRLIGERLEEKTGKWKKNEKGGGGGKGAGATGVKRVTKTAGSLKVLSILNKDYTEITRSSLHVDDFSTPPGSPAPPSHDGSGKFTPNSDDDKGCSICLNEVATDPVTMKCCSIVFCRLCIDKVLEYSSLCPNCRAAVKQVQGNQPTGTMSHSFSQLSLPGYEGSGTIVIKYTIPSGTQTNEHPNPGQRYHGTTREAYLPNTPEGQEVLMLLRKAFNARLIFTVGTSHTTGTNNAIVWNDIHHKTVAHGNPYGYPDPTYLSRVKEELKAKGIQ